MKPLKLGLRFWILISSIFSFLGGWALLSHAGKPTPFSMFISQSTDQTTADVAADPQTNITSLPTMATLQPIPSLDSLLSGASSGAVVNQGSFTIQPLQQAPSTTYVQPPSRAPRIRTHGS